ncbi:hypothetical protein [Rhizohabitans arisaemae]|uniref:hypothetical protein n=1 Tax=Rhizohabitans arisaemae TaxID=2720610 RepID=UPI0024B04B62|nr:hypothetical protein [Rhizohabitans arisaemae]
MSDHEAGVHGFIAHYQGRSYAANLGPGEDDVVLFAETAQEGWQAAPGYWWLRVSRGRLTWLVLLRTVGVFAGEPCMVLGEEADGLHIAYAGHDGVQADAIGYWQVDHGAYEVVVPPEEVQSTRVERIDLPAGTGWRPHPPAD